MNRLPRYLYTPHSIMLLIVGLVELRPCSTDDLITTWNGSNFLFESDGSTYADVVDF